MIVLDEQLLGRQIEQTIAEWYRGPVCFVTDLRAGIVKDDAIPSLLCRQRQPAFVTINTNHFWKRLRADRRFCVLCFNVGDKDVPRIPGLLKLLFRNRNFSTKAQRAGHIFRINIDEVVKFYNVGYQAPQTFQL
ncbi:MAG: hypothetical protein HY913_10040 [Desulfomonile tiedjei]|nr:hypothetical protein [Desulfomonile tiedjei]